MTDRFDVYGPSTSVRNGTQIDGRCLTDISIGQKFTTMTARSKVSRLPSGDLEIIYAPPIYVDLTVVEIYSWRLNWETISSGMTARLVVSGDASALVDNAILSD
jgi:hypothetical protein